MKYDNGKTRKVEIIILGMFKSIMTEKIRELFKKNGNLRFPLFMDNTTLFKIKVIGIWHYTLY